jgi:hypothetical protein
MIIYAFLAAAATAGFAAAEAGVRTIDAPVASGKEGSVKVSAIDELGFPVATIGAPVESKEVYSTLAETVIPSDETGSEVVRA